MSLFNLSSSVNRTQANHVLSLDKDRKRATLRVSSLKNTLALIKDHYSHQNIVINYTVPSVEEMLTKKELSLPNMFWVYCWVDTLKKVSSRELDYQNRYALEQHYREWAKILYVAKFQFVATNVQKVDIMSSSKEMDVNSRSYLHCYQLLPKRDDNVKMRGQLMKEYVYPICSLFWDTHVVFTGTDVINILHLYFLLRDYAVEDIDLDKGIPYKSIEVVNLYNSLIEKKRKKDESMMLSQTYSPIEIDLSTNADQDALKYCVRKFFENYVGQEYELTKQLSDQSKSMLAFHLYALYTTTDNLAQIRNSGVSKQCNACRYTKDDKYVKLNCCNTKRYLCYDCIILYCESSVGRENCFNDDKTYYGCKFCKKFQIQGYEINNNSSICFQDDDSENEDLL